MKKYKKQKLKEKMLFHLKLLRLREPDMKKNEYLERKRKIQE
jgi:hypothetical protein